MGASRRFIAVAALFTIFGLAAIVRASDHGARAVDLVGTCASAFGAGVAVADQVEKVRSGWVPEGYPKSWPSPERPNVMPPGTAPFSARIEREIIKRKQRIRVSVEDLRLVPYPREEVLDVLKFWGVQLE